MDMVMKCLGIEMATLHGEEIKPIVHYTMFKEGLWVVEGTIG
jgi:hypothetical protein